MNVIIKQKNSTLDYEVEGLTGNQEVILQGKIIALINGMLKGNDIPDVDPEVDKHKARIKELEDKLIEEQIKRLSDTPKPFPSTIPWTTSKPWDGILTTPVNPWDTFPRIAYDTQPAQNKSFT